MLDGGLRYIKLCEVCMKKIYKNSGTETHYKTV
jgi:hypothetical protein